MRSSPCARANEDASIVRVRLFAAVVAVLALASCARDKATALDLKLMPTGGTSTRWRSRPSCSTASRSFCRESRHCFQTPARALRDGEVLTLWFGDTAVGKRATVTAVAGGAPGGHAGGHHAGARAGERRQRPATTWRFTSRRRPAAAVAAARAALLAVVVPAVAPRAGRYRWLCGCGRRRGRRGGRRAGGPAARQVRRAARRARAAPPAQPGVAARAARAARQVPRRAAAARAARAARPVPRAVAARAARAARPVARPGVAALRAARPAGAARPDRHRWGSRRERGLRDDRDQHHREADVGREFRQLRLQPDRERRLPARLDGRGE